MTRLRVRSMCKSVKVKQEHDAEILNAYYYLFCEMLSQMAFAQNGRVRKNSSDPHLTNPELARQFDECIKQAEENKVRKEYFPHSWKDELFLFPEKTHNEISELILGNKALIADDPELKKKKEKVNLYLSPVATFRKELGSLYRQVMNRTLQGDSLNPIAAEESASNVIDDILTQSQYEYLMSNPIGAGIDAVQDREILDLLFHPENFTDGVGDGLNEDFTNVDVNENTYAATSQNMSAADVILKNDVLVSSSLTPAAGDPMGNNQQPSYERIITPDGIRNRNSVPVFLNHVESANDSVFAPSVSNCGMSEPLLAEMVPIAEGPPVFLVQQINAGSNFECEDTFQLTSTETSVGIDNEVTEMTDETSDQVSSGYSSGFDSRASSATPPREVAATLEPPCSDLDLNELFGPLDYGLGSSENPRSLVESNQVAKEPFTGVKLGHSLTLEAVESEAQQLRGKGRERSVPVITIEDTDAPTSTAASHLATPAVKSKARIVTYQVTRTEFVSRLGNKQLERKLCDRDDSSCLPNSRAEFERLGKVEYMPTVMYNSPKRKLCEMGNVNILDRAKLVKLGRTVNSNAMTSSSQPSSVTACRSSNVLAFSPWLPNRIITSNPTSNLIASSSQQSNLVVHSLGPAFVASSQKSTINTPSTQPPKFEVTSVKPSNPTILSCQPWNPIASSSLPPIPVVSLAQKPIAVVSSSRRANIKPPAPRQSSFSLPAGERTESGMLVYKGNARVNKVPISSAMPPAASQNMLKVKKPGIAENSKLTANVYSELNSSANIIKPEATQLQPLAPHNANIITLNDWSAYTNTSPFANSAHKSSPLDALPGKYFDNSLRANRSGNRNTNNACSNENSNSTTKRRGRKPKNVNNVCSNALGSSTSVESSPVNNFSEFATSGWGVSAPNTLIQKVSVASTSILNASQSKAAAPKVSGARNGRSKTTKASYETPVQIRKPRTVTPPVAQAGAARPPARRRRPANVDPAKREAHNRSERERRKELSGAFNTARTILLRTERMQKMPKVKVLATSIKRFGETYESEASSINDMSSSISLSPSLKDRRANKIAKLIARRKFNQVTEQAQRLKVKSHCEEVTATLVKRITEVIKLK